MEVGEGVKLYTILSAIETLSYLVLITNFDHVNRVLNFGIYLTAFELYLDVYFFE